MHNHEPVCLNEQWMMISSGKSRSFPLNFCMTLTCKTKTTSWSLKLSLPSWPATHFRSSHTHRQIHTHVSSLPPPPVRPVSCHSSPAAVTPVRPVSLLGDGVSTPSIHTPVSICLFVCLCRFVFWCLPSSCPSSPLRVSHAPVVTLKCLVFWLATSDCFALKCPWTSRCWVSPARRPTLYCESIAMNFVKTFIDFPFLNAPVFVQPKHLLFQTLKEILENYWLLYAVNLCDFRVTVATVAYGLPQ